MARSYVVSTTDTRFSALKTTGYSHFRRKSERSGKREQEMHGKRSEEWKCVGSVCVCVKEQGM